MANKGANFERSFCKTLSLWWSNRERDDLFWRSSMSGGRATIRGRQGKTTAGHCGDICSTHPMSAPLTNLITFELKSGYNKTAHVHTLMDIGKKTKQQMYEAWIEQAVNAAERAGTPHWMLIHRRDGREPFCFIDYTLFQMLKNHQDLFIPEPVPLMRFDGTFRKKDRTTHFLAFYGMKLNHFLFHVEPSDIIKLESKYVKLS